MGTQTAAIIIAVIIGIILRVFHGGIRRWKTANRITRKISPKEEWIRYSGLDWSDEDRWLRDNIAALFDFQEPDEQQRRLLQMADLRLSLFDLPAGANPKHKEELLALAHRQFGRTRRI